MGVLFLLGLVGLWLGVPAYTLRARTVNERFHWPARTVKKRVRVDVAGGAFRDGAVQYETEERVPEGAPRSLKALSYVAMLFGQLWPFAAFYAVVAWFSVLTSIGDDRAHGPAKLAGLLIAMALTAFGVGAKHAWSGSKALLEGEVFTARTDISRSIAGYGITALATVLSLLVQSFGARASLSLGLVAGALPLLLTAVACLQRVLFEERADKLVEAQSQARFTPLMAAAANSIRADAGGPDELAESEVDRPSQTREHKG